MTDLEAKNHGMAELPNHDERYAIADEFAEVMNAAFESWHPEDFKHDREKNQLVDSKNIEPFNHKGVNFAVKGPLSTPSSPQGKPVAMQAGASKQGVVLAVKYADAVYSVSWNIEQARNFRKRMDAEIAKQGYTDRRLKIFPGLVTYVGKTHEEALKRKQL